VPLRKWYLGKQENICGGKEEVINTPQKQYKNCHLWFVIVKNAEGSGVFILGKGDMQMREWRVNEM
jgi:hypothetical protein